MLGGAPLPAAKKKPVAQRVADGETVYLTDRFGKPTIPTASIYFDEPQVVTRYGYQCFTSKRPALVEFLNEPLPLPIRLECEVAMPFPPPAAEKHSHGGVYIGGRNWPGGRVAHYSVGRVLAEPFTDPQSPSGRSIQVSNDLFPWAEGRPPALGSSTFQRLKTDWDRDPKQETEPRFIPILVDVHPDEFRATIDGLSLRPVRSAEMFDRLRREARNYPPTADYPFAQPVLGDGIGITLQDTELIVRNLRVSRANP
jgi:hypothetical protein